MYQELTLCLAPKFQGKPLFWWRLSFAHSEISDNHAQCQEYSKEEDVFPVFKELSLPRGKRWPDM